MGTTNNAQDDMWEALEAHIAEHIIDMIEDNSDGTISTSVYTYALTADLIKEIKDFTEKWKLHNTSYIK